MNPNEDIQIVFLGRSRVGKSMCGNKVLGRPDVFKTSGAIESCTQDIKSATGQLKKSKSKKDLSEFSLIVTDTPGFPDTDPSKSVSHYNTIVGYVNDNKASEKGKASEAKAPIRQRIYVWVVAADLDTATSKVYKQYAVLMKEFRDANLNTFLLVNGKEAGADIDYDEDDPEEIQRKKKWEQEQKETHCSNMHAMIRQRELLQFAPEHRVEVSFNSTTVKDALRNIIVKALNESKHLVLREQTKVRLFDEVSTFYQSKLDVRHAQEQHYKHVQERVRVVEYDIGWHERRVRDCSIGAASGAVLTAVPLIGWIAGPAVAAGNTVAVADSQHKLGPLRDQLKALTAERDSYDAAAARQEFEEMKGSLADIYDAMGNPREAKKLRDAQI